MAGEETVEAHFFGRTSMAVLESVDAFARKTGLSLVESRRVETLPLDQECHRATFRVPPGPRPEAGSTGSPAPGPGDRPEPPSREPPSEMKKKFQEFWERMQDPEARRRFAMSDWELLAEQIEEALEERVGSRLDRLLEMVKGPGEESPPGPVDLPEGPMVLGRVAGSDLRFEWEPTDLKTHCIMAGHPGSGKSVSASVLVEEVLKMGVPVLCFDPTAQWTGFLRPNRDPLVFKAYGEFGMERGDARGFRGVALEVADPDAPIDFKRYLNPGEITVFTLNRLAPGGYDRAVTNFIDSLLRMEWEETIDLRLLLVFEDVHRLLEKYGGKGGYVALERGARELRKWGVGMLMISHVSGDLPGGLRANVLLEGQFHTRSPVDTDRIRQKYGDEYADRCAKLEIGVGMLAHPKYNRGRPVPVHFRPPLHTAHRLPDGDLEMYKTYAAELDRIEHVFADWRKKGIDTTDLELELKLAMVKFKEGRFRMAEVYLESLRTSMERFGGKGAARQRGM